MDQPETERLISQLAAGFETLESEYQKLFKHQQAVERKLATARQQYNELARLYDSSDLDTPPLSLSPTLPTTQDPLATNASDIIALSADESSREAAERVREGIIAAQSLKRAARQSETDGVKIWSGPSADRPEASSSIMPSIIESPLEQDFTIAGKPSQLGCPFASMARKKLSSHAASVLSRYNNREGSGAASASHSSVSRVNGRESFAQRQSRRGSIVDPIKAEICGLSDHVVVDDSDKPALEPSIKDHADANADVGVCPIRFLNQHSPEEVATYFERHKHELPRSHEVCVRRYQGNEQQVKQLDAKYGNLVSMIQGLGEKHKTYLPDEIDTEESAPPLAGGSNEKIQQWASSVSVQAANDPAAVEPVTSDGDGEDEERQPHFERPLREIRVGESPSRPWGISVPSKYIERAPSSNASSSPAEPSGPQPGPQSHVKISERPPGRCPFGFDSASKEIPRDYVHRGPDAIASEQAPPDKPRQPIFIAPSQVDPKLEQAVSSPRANERGMVFNNCPVFIGYSVEDATRILRESGFNYSNPSA